MNTYMLQIVQMAQEAKSLLSDASELYESMPNDLWDGLCDIEREFYHSLNKAIDAISEISGTNEVVDD